ncbi:translation initiation factor, putative [Paecilomyces variotii No. 5]|uniref:Methylthioribose-1-phosphate isomerase n=1 Tax=Byssochlamys spectabilis (strain No. 5 / NBRC 109023) TaxID=1356009 RepID=V5G751_BYSSN|nr:translation initiation factor, putative [Paecilomyces variotii No. 5]
MTLEAIKYDGTQLSILDQLQLPHVVEYIEIRSAEEGWHAIKEMKVRGAPAIAIVAALSLAVELKALVTDGKLSANAEEVQLLIREKLHYLTTSRPTAVNLSDAARKLEAHVSTTARGSESTGDSVASAFIEAAARMLTDDLADNQNIGKYGADWLVQDTAGTGKQEINVLTHCNTGSLATSGYGTALGVIRALHSRKALKRAYCTETRPYNQGSRLTAFELVHDNIPSTLITDSMAAALLSNKERKVSAIVVGADRVAANGDTANKVGTYGLAVLAKHHAVKFLVAAPRTTIDLQTKSGQDIIIEERPAAEVTRIKGAREGCEENDSIATVRVAAPGIDVWNPAFDVTPSALIDGIITEVGVVERSVDGSFNFEHIFAD